MKLLLAACFLAFLQQGDDKPLKDKQAEILAFVKGAKTEREFRAATGDLVKLADQALAINKYELAVKFYGDAERIARGSLKDAALGQQYQEAAKKAGDIGKEFSKAAKAIGAILRSEGTPEDYAMSGRFLCFVKGDWELGIADLAKGKEEPLQKLAALDLTGPTDAEGILPIGDAWAARKEPGAKERAAHWYAKAWPLTTGIAREKVRTKLHAIFFRPGKVLGVPVGWGTNNPANISLDETCSRFGARSLFIRPTGFHHYPKLRQAIPAGKTYVLSVWVMTDGSDKDFPVARLLYKEGAGLVGDPILAPVDQPWWVRLEKTITVPAGVELEFTCTGWYVAGKAWIDNLSLKSEDGVEFVDNGDFEK